MINKTELDEIKENLQPELDEIKKYLLEGHKDNLLITEKLKKIKKNVKDPKKIVEMDKILNVFKKGANDIKDSGVLD